MKFNPEEARQAHRRNSKPNCSPGPTDICPERNPDEQGRISDQQCDCAPDIEWITSVLAWAAENFDYGGGDDQTENTIHPKNRGPSRNLQ